MQIFLSHSSQQKPLVREIRKGLPHHLGAWIDEERLLFGDHIAASLEHTIKADTDYVLLFIDSGAAASPWVRKEIGWALEAEKTVGRTILLPVALDESAVHRLDNPQLESRKYLALQDFREASVRTLADSIAGELFALVCRDMHRTRSPAAARALSVIADAEDVVRTHAGLIQKAVFPHRRSNPIDRRTLRRVVNTELETPLGEDELDTLLTGIAQRNLVPGLHFDGEELYIVEEHALWKHALQRQKKELIAKKAASYLKNGDAVFLDAGSTTEQLVQILCRRIETRAITRMTVATTSINVADMLSDCCVKMGFDDDFSAIRLFVPGGQVRPGTQAIIPVRDEQPSQIAQISDLVGGFDLAVVGVNGVDPDAGFTTHEPTEAFNKREMIQTARNAVILGDSSKAGIVLEHAFAGFDDAVTLIIDSDPANPALQAILARHAARVVQV